MKRIEMQGTMPQTSELYHAKRAKYWNIIPFQKMVCPPGGGNRMLRQYFENVIPIACNCFCELRSALQQQDATEETHRSKYFNRLEIPASGSRSSKTVFFRKLLSRIVTIHHIHFLAEEPLAVSMHPDHSWQIIRRPCVTSSEGSAHRLPTPWYSSQTNTTPIVATASHRWKKRCF